MRESFKKPKITMKKIIAILAVAAVFAACNSGSDAAAKVDSAATAVVDSAAVKVDSAAKAAVDTAKAAVNNAAEAVKEAVKK